MKTLHKNLLKALLKLMKIWGGEVILHVKSLTLVRQDYCGKRWLERSQLHEVSVH
jgi:hypothetical protein